MNKIFLNIKTGKYVIENEVLSYDSYVLLKEFKEYIEELSGFVIIVNNKILLVKPKKFKGIVHKWSIPKGKTEGRKKFKNALKELQEETGIILNPNTKTDSEKVKIYYKKSGKLKELTTYIIRLNESDLNVDINHKWEVEKEHIDGKEIYKAKFFTKEEALNKIEMGQIPLLKMI
jgi:predicted NUDIX family NTP pyrophosphohydrolase